MTLRPWHRAAAVVLSGCLLGVMAQSAAGARDIPTDPPSLGEVPLPVALPLPVDEITLPTDEPQPASGEPTLPFGESPVPWWAELFPWFPPLDTSTTSPATQLPASTTPASEATNLGIPGVATLGIGGQNVQVPFPALM